MSMSLTTNLALVGSIQSERRSFAAKHRLARRLSTDIGPGRVEQAYHHLVSK